MNGVLLTTLLITEIQRYFITSEISKSLPPILQCGTSKVESDKEKAEMFNNYFYSVYTSSHFILPNMEELAKPTNSISDILLSYEEVYQVLSTLQIKRHVAQMALDLQFFKLVPHH